MSGVVFIICIPTDNYEKSLIKKVRKKVTIEEIPKVIPLMKSGDYSIINTDKLIPLDHSAKTTTNNKSAETQSMEHTLRDILRQLDITNSTWCKNDENCYVQVTFSVESSDRCEEILDILKENHIGHRCNSTVNVIPCTIQFHAHGHRIEEENSKFIEESEIEESYDNNSAWNRFLSSVKSRLAVAQVVENVKTHATLTFDFIFLILISTIMCAIGLVENSNVYLLSSMLICPMMGPVMAGTFGSVIEHRRLLKIGVQNELLGLGIATLVGFCYGSLICLITDKYGNQTWPTYEMISRGELRSLWVGCLIALLSGAAVALGILSDNIASLVGVAISTSLTPPAVNAGLLWSLASVYYFKGNETTRYNLLTQTNYYSKHCATELFALGAVSICLTFVNIVCIYLAAILVFKIKEVAPMASKDETRRRFWKHDIKIARDCNKTQQNEDDECIITKLSEEIAQLHKSKFNNEQVYHSTDVTRENLKMNIKRSEYTWSPCMHLSKKDRETNELYESFMRCKKSTMSRLLKFDDGKPCDPHRRLSQIFVPEEGKLNIIRETRNETSPSIDEISCTSSNASSGKQFVTRNNKIFIVTPCETDPLKQ